MTTLTPTRLAAMPRVNLLPPEIAAAARLQRLQGILAALVLVVLVAVVGFFVLVSSQIGGAEEELSNAQSENTQLQAEKAEYAQVPQVLNALSAARTNLVTAMTPEIRWSFYLNDISLTIPKTSRLQTLTTVNNAAAAQLDSTAVDTGSVTPLGAPSMGTVTFTGKALDFDAVAAWLLTLGRQDAVVEPTVTNVTENEDENTQGKFYDVESSAQLTPDAASERYLQVETGE